MEAEEEVFQDDSEILSGEESVVEDVVEDEFDLFDEPDEERDWREIIQGGGEFANEFHMNSKDKLMGESSRNVKEKPRKTKGISEEKIALKAYYYLIRMWFFKEVMKCARRMHGMDYQQKKNTGKLLSMVGFDNVHALVQARGKRIEVIVELIDRVLIETELKGLPNLTERVIYLLNFCGVEARVLTLVNLQNFNLFEKFKIRNRGMSRKKKFRNKSQKVKDYIKWMDENSQSESEAEAGGKNQEFDDLEKYSFMSKKYVNHFIESGATDSTKKYTFKSADLPNSFLRPNEWLELYNQKARAWKPFNLSTFTFMVDDDIKTAIQGMATVFIYSAKVLGVKEQYKHLLEKRPFKSVEIMDQTLRFCDGLVRIRKRRSALDLKRVIERILKFGEYHGPLSLLNSLEVSSRKQSMKLIEKIVTKLYFPKSLFEFSVSDFVVVPSQVPKFDYLPPSAEPIQGLEFQGEKVYSRDCLIHVHSQYGWIDVGRKVRDEEYPRPCKQTLTKQNKELRLFTFDQTAPFKWELEDNKFVKNEYDNVYINSFSPPPEGVCIIPENVSFVCKKQGLEHSKVIQGFLNGRPNLIGHAIFIKDKDRVLELHKERIEFLEQKKQKAKRNNLLMIWKKIIKAIRVENQLKMRYQVKV